LRARRACDTWSSGPSTSPLGAMQRHRIVLALGFWLVGLTYLAATTRPFPIVELIGGVALAMLAGLFSMRGSARATRIARYMVWVNAIGGLVWAMAFAPDMFAGAWLAGVCAFGLVVSLERVLWRQIAL
jgi:hypothetical protein